MKICLLLYASYAAIFSRIYEGATELKQEKIMMARFSGCVYVAWRVDKKVRIFELGKSFWKFEVWYFSDTENNIVLFKRRNKKER